MANARSGAETKENQNPCIIPSRVKLEGFSRRESHLRGFRHREDGFSDVARLTNKRPENPGRVPARLGAYEWDAKGHAKIGFLTIFA